jgi:hypothetical protein
MKNIILFSKLIIVVSVIYIVYYIDYFYVEISLFVFKRQIKLYHILPSPSRANCKHLKLIFPCSVFHFNYAMSALYEGHRALLTESSILFNEWLTLHEGYRTLLVFKRHLTLYHFISTKSTYILN